MMNLQINILVDLRGHILANDEYIKSLENTLMNALDELMGYYKKDYEYFDYYDLLSKLSNWTNSEVLEFLEKYGDDDDE